LQRLDVTEWTLEWGGLKTARQYAAVRKLSRECGECHDHDISKQLLHLSEWLTNLEAVDSQTDYTTRCGSRRAIAPPTSDDRLLVSWPQTAFWEITLR